MRVVLWLRPTGGAGAKASDEDGGSTEETGKHGVPVGERIAHSPPAQAGSRPPPFSPNANTFICCIYMYMYIYMQHVHVHVHAQTYVSMDMDMHIRMYLYMYFHMYFHMYFYICLPRHQCVGGLHPDRGGRGGVARGTWGLRQLPHLRRGAAEHSTQAQQPVHRAANGGCGLRAPVASSWRASTTDPC